MASAGCRRGWCKGLRAWFASVPHENIQQEYGRNVAFVFPSLHDSGGMVVLESLAAGLPVICLEVGRTGRDRNSFVWNSNRSTAAELKRQSSDHWQTR